MLLPYCFRWESYQRPMGSDTSVCSDKKARYSHLQPFTDGHENQMENIQDQGCKRAMSVDAVGNKQV